MTGWTVVRIVVWCYVSGNVQSADRMGTAGAGSWSVAGLQLPAEEQHKYYMLCTTLLVLIAFHALQPVSDRAMACQPAARRDRRSAGR